MTELRSFGHGVGDREWSLIRTDRGLLYTMPEKYKLAIRDEILVKGLTKDEALALIKLTRS